MSSFQMMRCIPGGLTHSVSILTASSQEILGAMATRALGLERIRSNANVDSLVTQDYADHWIELQVPLNLKEHVGKIHFDISRGNWQSPHICMEAKSGARIYGRIPLTTLQQWATAEHASSPA